MKKVLIGFVFVFIAMILSSIIIDGIILSSTYESLKNVWRPDISSNMWLLYIVMLVGSFFFSFVFAKGYENKGILEGLRYGLYIGIWMSVSMAYGIYAMIDIPYTLALQWLIFGIIKYVLCGVVLAIVFAKVK